MLSLDQISVEQLTTELVVVLKKSRIPDDKSEVTAITIPSHELKGFDSLTIIEVLTDFEKRTGLYFSDEIFQDPTSKQMRSVHQIALSMFSELIAERKKDAAKQ